MKLQHVVIENFMGIQSAEFDVGDSGILFVGKSKSGKTSLANAPYAALKSKGFGPEFICDDADRWRILLKFDTATVQTIVRRSGSKEVKVDGLGLGSPQAKLDAIFPDLIDPWKLAQDEPATRRRKVLAAMPASVTAADMHGWTGEPWASPTEGKHGLDVVKEAHDHYYARRAQANVDAKAAELAYKQANEEAERLASPDHVGVVVPLAGEEDAPVREAEASRKQLDQRKADAEAMATRMQGTRDKIAKLREDAAEKDAEAEGSPTADEYNTIKAKQDAVSDEIAELNRKLADAQERYQAIDARRVSMAMQMQHATTCMVAAIEWRKQAADLEATLATAVITAPTADEIAAADLAITQATALAARVRAARAAHAALAKASVLADEAALAKAEAKRLDAIVKALDNDAPAELAKRANLVEGLTFVDDDIALDGKVFKVLCESEKTELCVDLVKRIAPDAKLLRIDRMEGMDPDTREDFIRKAKAGGWQIIGTVVERGEMKIVTIDADGEQSDAPVSEIKKAKGKRVKVVMPEGV